MKGTAATAELSHLISRLGIRQGRTEQHDDIKWSLDLLTGRFAELSSAGETAAFSAAVSIILQAQQRGEPSAWVTVGTSSGLLQEHHAFRLAEPPRPHRVEVHS